MLDHYTIHFDGSCWPNPGGDAAYGYTVHRGAELIASGHKYMGRNEFMSNNVAEFKGLEMGLRAFCEYSDAHELTERVRLSVFGDSQLVINIMNGKWSMNADRLYYEFAQFAFLAAASARLLHAQIAYDWIPREQNTECDELSKRDVPERTAEERKADCKMQYAKRTCSEIEQFAKKWSTRRWK